MIYDHIRNAALYEKLSPRFKQVFDYIQAHDISALPEGKTEIAGKEIYVAVAAYMTKEPGKGKWEAHKRYIDLQYMLRGSEQVWIGQLPDFVQGEYDEAKDFLPLSGEGQSLTFREGEFMIFFPNDAHRPSMAIQSPETVRKAVFKIAVD